MIPAALYTPIVCAFCKRDRTAHRRDNGECKAFERAEHKPYRLVLRRVPEAAAGWKVICG